MKLTIIGASGHGKVVADIAQLVGYDEIRFLDDDSSLKTCGAFPVVGTVSEAANVDGDLFVAIGSATTRKRIMEQLPGRAFPILIHPGGTVASTASIGDGTVIMAGAVVSPYAKLGRGCIINTCASVDHDCVVDSFVHVAVGAHLCGTVTVGTGTWVGAGATIINNVSVCSETTIGAGAVVVGSIIRSGTYMGVPAKLARL